MLGSSATGRRPRLARIVAGLALIPLVSGCAAVVAIPLVAGGVLYTRDKVRVRAATPAAPVTAPAPATDRAKLATAPAAGVILTDLRELPPPTPGQSGAGQPDAPWTRFFAYALEPGAAIGGQLESALLAAGGALDEPKRRECPSAHPAVIVDLDPGEAAFAPEALAPASPEVSQGFASLRSAGVTVLWIATLPAARAGDVAGALRTAGFDPRGEDQLLLIRNAEDRKQMLREQANQDVCIVAIAGDRRADFDELFDYLRNPAAAAGLYPMMGNGWFLVPVPTGAVEPEEAVNVPADRSAAPD